MNWILNLISKLFLKPKIVESEIHTVKNCEILDDIWVQDGNKIYSGVIWSKTRRRILVSYCKDDNSFVDEWFITTNLSDETKIKKNNLTLYFNKPCFTD